MSKEHGDAALRLRRRLMRTCCMPRDVPEYATSETLLVLNDSIRVLNFTRRLSDIIEGTMSQPTDEHCIYGRVK